MTLKQKIGATTLKAIVDDILESIADDDARQLLKDVAHLRVSLDRIERAADERWHNPPLTKRIR